VGGCDSFVELLARSSAGADEVSLPRINAPKPMMMMLFDKPPSREFEEKSFE